jgi:hypothetical protein
MRSLRLVTVYRVFVDWYIAKIIGFFGYILCKFVVEFITIQSTWAIKRHQKTLPSLWAATPRSVPSP